MSHVIVVKRMVARSIILPGKSVPSVVGCPIPVDGVTINQREHIPTLTVSHIAVRRLGLSTGAGRGIQLVDIIEGQILGSSRGELAPCRKSLDPRLARLDLIERNGHVAIDLRKVGLGHPGVGGSRLCRLTGHVIGAQPTRKGTGPVVGAGAVSFGRGILDRDIYELVYAAVVNLGLVRLERFGQGLGRIVADMAAVAGRRGIHNHVSNIDRLIRRRIHFRQGVNPLTVAGSGGGQDIFLGSGEGVPSSVSGYVIFQFEGLVRTIHIIERQDDTIQVDRKGEDREIQVSGVLLRNRDTSRRESDSDGISAIRNRRFRPGRAAAVIAVDLEGEFAVERDGAISQIFRFHFETRHFLVRTSGRAIEFELKGRESRPETKLDTVFITCFGDVLVRSHIAVFLGVRLILEVVLALNSKRVVRVDILPGRNLS